LLLPTIRWTAIIALAIICICLSCGQQEKAEGLAKVGSRVITDADLDQRMEGMPPYMREQLSTPEGRKRLLDGVIEEELLYQDALAKGLDRSEEYKHQLELRKRDILIRQYYDSVVLPRSEPTDAEITEYYESHQDEFHMPASVEVRHILVETKAEAEKLRKRIEAGEDFGKLAEQYSLDQFSRYEAWAMCPSLSKPALDWRLARSASRSRPPRAII
jgi:EpsD family peptidyl-prolyl cis-trans isomerase